MVAYLDNLSATAQGRARMSLVDRSSRDISQACLTMHLKSMAEVSHVTQSFLQMCFPGSNCQPALHETTTSMLVQFRIDLTYMSITRDASVKECLLKFAWGDASPQGGNDYLLFKYRYVAARNLLACADALIFLIKSPGGVLGGELGEDVEIPFGNDRARVEAASVLVKHVFEHLCAPTTMGQGHTAAEDKVSSILHLVSMEVFDAKHLLRFFDEIMSFTSDLGTEVKVTDFYLSRERLSSIMQLWLSTRVNRAPPEPDLLEDGQEPPYLNPLQQCDGSACFNNAMPMAGAGHMIHNVMKGLPSVLDHYAFLFEELAIVEQALTHNGRRERIVAKCMLETPYASQSELITSFSFTLHKERWGAVAAFAAAALQPVAILRRCWSREAYEERGAGVLLERQWSDGDDEKRFEPVKFTELLRSSLFRHYHHMVVRMKYVPTRLYGWFDSCPCHDELLSTATTVKQRRRLLQQGGIPSGSCIFCSCRVWELIDGKLAHVIRALGLAIEADITEAMDMKNHDGLSMPLLPKALVVIMADFRAGIAYLQLRFSIRLAWTRNLPWM